MKKCFIVLAGLLCAAPALAQTPPAPQAPLATPQAPPPPTDIALNLKRQHAAIRKNLAASAAKMGEADYGFRPQGVDPVVRTFGQLVVHLANANNSFCARALGEPAKPNADEKGTMTKVDTVKMLEDSLAVCDRAHEALTGASAIEMLKIQGRNNVVVETARVNPLINNLAHNNEHYGNLVTYMRAKGLVPPSSEGR
ncbi:MAG TPA: DinB family protein [Vicinamibacterales bacterium]|nr:DinB family protein [Vicinamibacterales bacterium]